MFVIYPNKTKVINLNQVDFIYTNTRLKDDIQVYQIIALIKDKTYIIAEYTNEKVCQEMFNDLIKHLSGPIYFMP